MGQEEIKKPFKLPKAFKDRWVAALRSGEYSQTKSKLCDDDGYCCLGVAGSLLGIDDDIMQAQYNGEDVGLPNELPQKYQSLFPEELLDNPVNANIVGILTQLNDGITLHSIINTPENTKFHKVPKVNETLVYSFEEIAQWIEDNVEGYENNVDWFGKAEKDAKIESLKKALADSQDTAQMYKERYEAEKILSEQIAAAMRKVSKEANHLHAKLWDITNALNKPVGLFSKSKRRLKLIEQILTRDESNSK